MAIGAISLGTAAEELAAITRRSWSVAEIYDRIPLEQLWHPAKPVLSSADAVRALGKPASIEEGMRTLRSIARLVPHMQVEEIEDAYTGHYLGARLSNGIVFLPDRLRFVFNPRYFEVRIGRDRIRRVVTDSNRHNLKDWWRIETTHRLALAGFGAKISV